MRHSMSCLFGGLVLLCNSLPVMAQESLQVPHLDATAALPQAPDVLIKVIAFENADVKEVNRIFEALFPAAEPQSSLLPFLRFSIDERSNSIVVSGAADDLQVIEDLANRLDSCVQKNPARQTRSTVYRLQNVAASDTADAINQWLTERKRLYGKPGPDGGQASNVDPQCVVVAEVVSNSLIVSSSLDEQQRAELEQVIRGLDRRPEMIKVKVVLKKTVNGVETILARPQLLTFENLSGSVTVGSEAESYTIELTPYLIREAQKPNDVLGDPSLPSRR